MKKLILAILTIIAAGALVQPAQAAEVPPTFAGETINDDTVKFRFGHNLVVAGNNLNNADEVNAGFMIMAGNNLALGTDSEYGFVLGNTINFSGRTVRDLYLAGNTITLDKAAEIGRDVYAAGNIISVYTNITGDVSATAETVVLRDVKIDGNLNLEVGNLRVEGEVEVAGTVNYNDDATVSGLNQLTAGKIETYHIEEIDPSVTLVAQIYAKLFSAAALFLVMVVIAACYRKFHEKIADESEPSHLGMNLAIGLVTLIIVPVIALFALISLIGAPLGIIAIVLYVLGIYLAQGFAGVWLGHMLLEKAFKAKGNVYVEALLGIAIIAILSFIPWLGSLIYFLSLVLGLGLIVACIKPTKVAKPAPKAVKA